MRITSDISAQQDMYSYFLGYLNTLYYGIYENKDAETLLYKSIKNEHDSFITSLSKTYTTIIYDSDHIISLDYPQSADITLHRLAGDCEDFARVGCVIALAYGYKPKIIIMFKEENNTIVGHSICIVPVNNTIYAFDIYSYHSAPTIEKALGPYKERYKTFYIYDFDISKPVNKRVVKSEKQEIKPVEYGVTYINYSKASSIEDKNSILYTGIGIAALISILILMRGGKK
ncbi:MAG TPA: hypothetical protein DCG38_05085 [Eubacteriaceae bacterium]|nr:hypothetical protein [Eubacteriaceae bacterium]